MMVISRGGGKNRSRSRGIPTGAADGAASVVCVSVRGSWWRCWYILGCITFNRTTQRLEQGISL